MQLRIRDDAVGAHLSAADRVSRCAYGRVGTSFRRTSCGADLRPAPKTFSSRIGSASIISFDSDMHSAGAALLRAARRAREIAQLMRDGFTIV